MNDEDDDEDEDGSGSGGRNKYQRTNSQGTTFQMIIIIMSSIPMRVGG